jgi:hypothetical protein
LPKIPLKIWFFDFCLKAALKQAEFPVPYFHQEVDK